MAQFKETAITPELQAEFEEVASEAMATLGLSDNSSPNAMVKAVGDFIDVWQAECRNNDQAVNDPNIIIDTALSLGIVWGNAVCRELGWQWACIEYEDLEWYVVVSPNRAYACYPTYPC